MGWSLREHFDWACCRDAAETPRFKFRKLDHNGWWVYLWHLQSICIGSLRKEEKENGEYTWEACVYAPSDETWNQTPRAYKDWEAANQPTEQGGFHTRKEAGGWMVERSLQIGRLHEERLKLLSPLEQLAECAE